MNKNSNFFERIMQIAEYYGYNSANDFAKNALNYSSSEKINRLKKENNKPSIDILLDISNKFENINLNWLLAGEEPMFKIEQEQGVISAHNSPTGTPLVSIEAIGGFGSAEFSISENDILGRYVVPDFARLDFMIRVAGDSMVPRYSPGDIVGCRIIRESKFIQWGRVYVIATREQGILIKRVDISEQEGCILAKSDNEQYGPFVIPEEEITGMALVVGIIRLE